MNSLLLGSLERVRQRREDLSLRVLQAASRAAEAARLKVDQCKCAEDALANDIVVNRKHPYREEQWRQVPMPEVHRSHSRIELLTEQLLVAQGETRAALAALQEREARRLDALREHLLARARHDNAHEQLRAALQKQQSLRERQELEAAQERGLSTVKLRV